MAKLTKAQQAEVDRILKLTDTKTGLKTLLKRPWDGPDVLRLTKAQWEPIRIKLEAVPYSPAWSYPSSSSGYLDGKYTPNRWTMSGDLRHMRSTAEMIAFLMQQTVREHERFAKKMADEGKKEWDYPYNKRPGKLEFVVIQKSVSRSGMYRHLKLSVQTKDGLHCISAGAAAILDWPYHDHDGCIGVSGCGMDMHFHTVYSLVNTVGNAMLKKKGDARYYDFDQNLYRISSY
jgi:hypothetical protein